MMLKALLFTFYLNSTSRTQNSNGIIDGKFVKYPTLYLLEMSQSLRPDASQFSDHIAPS